MNDVTVAEFTIQFRRFLNDDSTLNQPLPDFFTPSILTELYRLMSLTRAIDNKAINLQRTGKMSTYPSSKGQEAIAVAVGHAMSEQDVFCPYYRDQGTLIQRGTSISQLYQYWGGDERGSLTNTHSQDFPICIPIATQYLHATGVAFAFKHRKQARAVVATGGEGSTSKGDFYEAINLAGAWQLPVVFVINNNQWAISVPRKAQTHCQTIAQKAIAAGIPSLQVDGNDVVAVRQSVAEALEKARSGGGPTLIEGICYRLCDHTTADDASRYRTEQEVETAWQQEPIARLAHYMEKAGFWSKQHEADLAATIQSTLDEAVDEYLSRTPQTTGDLIEHTFCSLPNALVDQKDELGEAPCP